MSSGGTKYDNVDLKENEWSDYCEKVRAVVHTNWAGDRMLSS